MQNIAEKFLFTEYNNDYLFVNSAVLSPNGFFDRCTFFSVTFSFLIADSIGGSFSLFASRASRNSSISRRKKDLYEGKSSNFFEALIFPLIYWKHKLVPCSFVAVWLVLSCGLAMMSSMMSPIWAGRADSSS